VAAWNARKEARRKDAPSGKTAQAHTAEPRNWRHRAREGAAALRNAATRAAYRAHFIGGTETIAEPQSKRTPPKSVEVEKKCFVGESGMP